MLRSLKRRLKIWLNLVIKFLTLKDLIVQSNILNPYQSLTLRKILRNNIKKVLIGCRVGESYSVPFILMWRHLFFIVIRGREIYNGVKRNATINVTKN